jgi:hypothetical protein
MSSEGGLSFNAKAVRARKEHICFTCRRPIVVGQIHVAYPGKNHAGKFSTTRLCIECSYLQTQCNGKYGTFVREGSFTDLLIPNFLRKKRAEFRQAPKKAIESAGLTRSNPENVTPLSQVVVKKSEIERRIFHFPESRFRVSHFVKGACLTLRAGVNGRTREVRIIMACSTTGEAFGCSKRQVAVLVA